MPESLESLICESKRVRDRGRCAGRHVDGWLVVYEAGIDFLAEVSFVT
jgi:hypothetical protein